MINKKTRVSILGIAAAYFLYLAYQLFEGRNDPNSTMPMAVLILFVVLFVLAAVGVGFYAWRLWKQADKEEEKQQDSDATNLK